MKEIRKIIFYEKYFADFYSELPESIRRKIAYVFDIIRQTERVPVKFLKHIEGTNGLYEIRIEYESNIYRIFCCFDSGQIVVLFNAFQKKTEKTPQVEIKKALKLKDDYFNKKLKND